MIEGTRKGYTGRQWVDIMRAFGEDAREPVSN